MRATDSVIDPDLEHADVTWQCPRCGLGLWLPGMHYKDPKPPCPCCNSKKA